MNISHVVLISQGYLNKAQTGWFKQQNVLCLILEARNPRSCFIIRVGSFWGLCSVPPSEILMVRGNFWHSHSLISNSLISPKYVSLFPNFLFYKVTNHIGLGAHTTNFYLSEIPLFSTRSYSEGLTIRTSTYGFWGDTVQPITHVFVHNTVLGSAGDPKYYKTTCLWEQGNTLHNHSNCTVDIIGKESNRVKWGALVWLQRRAVETTYRLVWTTNE